MVPFTPNPASTVNIDVGAASASVSLGITQRASVQVTNDGTATAWINFGGSGVTAALATGIPVRSGATLVFATNQPYVAAIAAGATGKIYFTPGSGGI